MALYFLRDGELVDGDDVFGLAFEQDQHCGGVDINSDEGKFLVMGFNADGTMFEEVVDPENPAHIHLLPGTYTVTVFEEVVEMVSMEVFIDGIPVGMIVTMESSFANEGGLVTMIVHQPAEDEDETLDDIPVVN